MNFAAKVMSRNPWTWRAWMTIGTPFVVSSFLLMIAADLVMHAWQMWKWEWRDQWAEWFRAFTERHRKSLHSLGLKPERGGTLHTKAGYGDPNWKRVEDQVWLFEDRGPGQEFSHVRQAEDLQ